MTLDGMFQGPRPWDLAALEYAWGDELERFSLEQAAEVEGLVFGRRTYEGMAAHWSTATGEIADFMNAVPKYVFSRTLERADWANSTPVKTATGAVATTRPTVPPAALPAGSRGGGRGLSGRGQKPAGASPSGFESLALHLELCPPAVDVSRCHFIVSPPSARSTPMVGTGSIINFPTVD